MNEKSIDYQNEKKNRQEGYRYRVYDHRLISPDGSAYIKPFIVIRNSYGVIVRFTNLHNYANIYENKVFVPITSDAKGKLRYICKMLNYVLIEHYGKFQIKHIFRISREALECFFRDYATEKLPNGEHRGEQSVERCVYAVTEFFRKLNLKHGGHVLMQAESLHTEYTIYSKYGKQQKKKTPEFQVRGVRTNNEAFRELPTKVFKILLNLTFRYAPDIAFAVCLQAFAGLRAGEVCNVRQESSPIGAGIILTIVEGRIVKAEINLTRELSMRSDGIVCGKIKKERKQCVYPPFLDAFSAAYEHHKRFLATRTYESEYCPMFINKRGKAMTYDDYSNRFKSLVENHLRSELLKCDDAECRIYGQLLYENRLTTHSLRHWYSVQLVLNGEGIAGVQYWRGDRNPESAFTYLQNKGDLVIALENTNEALTEFLIEEGGRHFGKIQK
jgi:Phage integrase family.